jgi:hypothetical protein
MSIRHDLEPPQRLFRTLKKFLGGRRMNMKKVTRSILDRPGLW